jgi:hypothetical protein
MPLLGYQTKRGAIDIELKCMETEIQPSGISTMVLLHPELSALGGAILFNLVFAYLFEHSLIAVDVNQSLHEIWGGVFLCIHFRFETIALVLHAKGRTSVLVF